jgi:hypothetical protein
VRGGAGESAPGTLGQRQGRYRAGWAWPEALHEGVDTLGGIFMPVVGERQVDHGGVKSGVPQ